MQLYSAVNNFARGITHIRDRHESDFAEPHASTATEHQIIQSLQETLVISNFRKDDTDSRDNRYLWRIEGSRGRGKELVTVMDRRGNDYELITAFLRNVRNKSSVRRSRGTKTN